MLHKLLLSLGVATTTILISTTQANAFVLKPTNIGLSQPSGSNNVSGQPYTDDVYLDSLEFPEATFGTSGSFSPLATFEVLSGRDFINAEWGDNDTDSDGDDAPFAKIGQDPSEQETTEATIQDAALLNVFNSLSLTEMSDGEGASRGSFTFRALFQKALADDDNVADDVPELIFFERGTNDQFEVRVITGKEDSEFTYSDWVTMNSNNFWRSGVQVNTMEIGGGQQIGVGGIDFNVLGLSNGETVYGFELTSLNGTGPDLNGMFLSTEDPGRFQENPYAAVPEPTTVLGAMLAGGLGLFASKKRKEVQS